MSVYLANRSGAHTYDEAEREELDRDAKAMLKQFRVTIGERGKAHLLCGRFLITISQIQPRGRSPYLPYGFWKRPD